SGTSCSHHGDLRRRPCEIQVCANVFGVHHIVSTTVCLPCDHRYTGNSCLREREESLRADRYDRIPLLIGARKKTRNIDAHQESDDTTIKESSKASHIDTGR